MEGTAVKCKNCGADLTDIAKPDEKVRTPCPDCSSTERTIIVILTESLVISESISLKCKDETGFLKHELRQRDSVSQKTGNPVKIAITVDRTNPDQTVTIHEVEEKKDGIFQRIHKDIKTGSAKRRPTKK
jgi:DNA-directed RNA polymerase subunit RPC12/RpoP